jgi:cellulose synthase/poly-beta-1,6-N-acetylglucosamine synthase-like glycosyltransferase
MLFSAFICAFICVFICVFLGAISPYSTIIPHFTQVSSAFLPFRGLQV